MKKYNYKSIVILVIVIICIIIFNYYTSKKQENFTWSRDLINDFLDYQSTVNENNYQFNMKYLQEQASPDEAEELLKNGYWPWSEETKNEYKDAVSRNKMIKLDPDEGLNDAMKVYNETAAKRLLSWNTKEGQFLIYGSNDGNTTFQCSEDKNGNNVMRKNTLEGYNLWNGYKNEKNVTISSDNMENEIPGFTFVKNKCNPCVPLNDEPDYSCPFKLNVNGDDKISPVWEKLWGVK